MRTAPVTLADLSEAEFTLQLIGTKTNPGIARMLGWTCYHTLRSRGSEPGFPDWTMWRERVVFLELKSEVGKVSDAQKMVVRGLLDAGAEAYIVRPRHLDDIAKVIGTNSTWDSVVWDKGARAAADRLRSATDEAIA